MNSGDFYAQGSAQFVAGAAIGNAVGTAVGQAATYRDCMMASGYNPRDPQTQANVDTAVSKIRPIMAQISACLSAQYGAPEAEPIRRHISFNAAEATPDQLSDRSIPQRHAYRFLDRSQETSGVRQVKPSRRCFNMRGTCVLRRYGGSMAVQAVDCYVGLCSAAVSIASRALSRIGGPSRWGRSRAGLTEHPRRPRIARSARKASGSGRRFRRSISIIPVRGPFRKRQKTNDSLCSRTSASGLAAIEHQISEATCLKLGLIGMLSDQQISRAPDIAIPIRRAKPINAFALRSACCGIATL